MNPMWTAAKQETLKNLFTEQKKASKAVPIASTFSSKILPLAVINDFHLLVLAFKVKHNMVKNNVALHYVQNIHQFGTRQSKKFYVYTHESRFGLADFKREV